MNKTKDKLINDLKDAPAPDWMIRNAEQSLYDNFKSPLNEPILQLINDCEAIDLTQLAERAKNGEYDGTKEEANFWLGEFMKEIMQSREN